MKKDLEKRLVQKKVRPTAIRLMVLETLQQQKSAVSLNDLEVRFEEADRVTLYRTLKTFEEMKLIHSIEDGTGTTKFALCADGCECAPEDIHVHFFCKDCQETYCLTDYHINEISLPKDFISFETNVLVKGTCSNCRK